MSKVIGSGKVLTSSVFPKSLEDVSILFKQGTTAIAPMQLVAGALLSAERAGAMEMDAFGGLYLTSWNHRRFISQSSDSLIVPVTATTIASTLLWRGIVNANELKEHRVLLIRAAGLYTAINNEVATLTLKIGGTSIGAITTPVGAITDGVWALAVYITVRSVGVTGTISAYGEIDADTGATRGLVDSFVLDTTIINNMDLEVTWSAVGNSLTLSQAWITVHD